MRIRRRSSSLLVALCVGLVVAGCTTTEGTPDQPKGGSPSRMAKPSMTVAAGEEPATDPAFAAFYGQNPSWEGCGEGVECATVTVPVSWDAPDGDTLDLALSRVQAGDQANRLGSLLVNPGGPGGSGADYVAQYAEYIASPTLLDRYDLVGFDPRGVGASDPLDCLPDSGIDEFLAFSVDPSTDEGLAALTAESDEFAAACATGGGELLAHLDTLSVARDLDVLRAAMGDDHLNYLGFSYGTLIGADYADMFPQRVGRVVLDGVVDPAASFEDLVKGQAVGFEDALRAYVTACLAGDSGGECPLRGDVQAGLDQVASLLAGTREQPLRTDSGRELTTNLAIFGLIYPLYEDAIWYQLDEALTTALNGDGTAMLALADSYADRNDDGTYSSNLLEVINAVNCLDTPVDGDVADMRSLAAELSEIAPTMGQYLAYSEVVCAVWDAPPTRTPAPVVAAGAAPILVVGTTGDPATPYASAQALAGQLESGRLLTFEGEGHTAYPRGGDCVIGAVDGYLVDGVLPGDGATC